MKYSFQFHHGVKILAPLEYTYTEDDNNIYVDNGVIRITIPKPKKTFGQRIAQAANRLFAVRRAHNPKVTNAD